MQDADAARRLAILRGETPPPLPEAEQPADPSDKKHTRRDCDGTFGGGGRKRKRAGEDDTEFEMRVARERAEEGSRVADELAGASGSRRQKQKETEEVNIVDSRGHIDLIGPVPKDAGGGGEDDRNETVPESHRSKARQTVEKYERNHRNGVSAGKPWYEEAEHMRLVKNAWFFDACVAAATLTVEQSLEDEREAAVREARRKAERLLEAPTTDVWGRDDPKRRERETARLDANDPLAAMRSGAKKVRDVLKERRKDAEERGRELEQLRQEERRREKRRKREHARGDEEKDEDENEDRPLPESHRSGRSDRSHHGDERHESRRVHVHREERRRRREAEHPRDREHDRHHGRERASSRERGTSSRAHRDQDKDERHDHRRGKDHERRDKHHACRDSEAKRTE